MFQTSRRKRRSKLLKLFIILFAIYLIITHIPQRFVPFPFAKTLSCEQCCSYSSTYTIRSIYFNLSRPIRHFPEFICPQNFRNLADWIYEWPNQFNEKIETETNNGKLIAPCLPHGSIIYVRQWSIDRFFTQVYPHLINRFVLITGEGDDSAPTHLEILDAPDSKIIHWFGQNGQYSPSKTNKFTHIPIGNRFPLYILH